VTGAHRLSPRRALAEDIRRNPRLAPVVGQVIDLLGPFAERHPTTKIRHVEEIARCRLPNGDHHRAGFVAFTSTGIVLVWKQGFMWRAGGEFELAKQDSASTRWTETSLTATLRDGSMITIDWLPGSAERLGAEAAFRLVKPLASDPVA
jgi:hypothetical protein